MPRLPTSQPLKRSQSPLEPPVSTGEHQGKLGSPHDGWREWGDVPSDPPNPTADGSLWFWYNTTDEEYKVKLGDGTVHVIAPPTGGGGGGTLDDAYNEGGAGAGRQINVDSGSVLLASILNALDGSAQLRFERASGDTGEFAYDVFITGETQPRLRVRADGKIQLGPGSGTAPRSSIEDGGATGVVRIGNVGSSGGGISVTNLYEDSANFGVTAQDGLVVNDALAVEAATATLSAAGLLTVAAPWMQVASNSGTSDDLDTISISGMPTQEGNILFVSAQSTHTITIRDKGVSGGHIETFDGNPIVLDAVEKIAILFRKSSTVWYAATFVGGSAGGASVDAVTDLLANGNWKVFYSDGSGDGQELALGALGTYLKSAGASSAPVFDTPPLSIELSNLAQGSSKVLHTFVKATGTIYTVLVIAFQTTPTVGHSFTFFKNGSTNLGAVTVTTSGTLWTTTVSAFGFAVGDTISVRHDTNAQDGDESASHTDEGGRIEMSIA